ncbi:MAG: calcineurin-like phosphoesterase C-terminal domain-containing protein [Clostridium sp.]|nr:calcineurin-like phosphoesterase C-terminal domain-containing protein [Bacteroides sp.]MCM1199418.1 calcineurin-like phosphoesterase C-terminal domain-containing protein [Clostridium sp.]
MKRLILIINILLLSSAFVQARKVTGNVTCDGSVLGGVVVTDGKNFTVTKNNGKFSFSIEDNADFVYVVTPSGYTADFSSGAPAFYLPAKDRKEFNFELVRTSDSEDYTIIAIADPQTQSMKHFSKFCGKPLADLVSQAHISSARGTTIGIVLGDICWDTTEEILPKFKEEIKKTGIPFYPVIGNHDHKKDFQGDHETSSVYRSIFGPENYAFFVGKDLVIVLDNVIYDTQKKYVEGYTDAQVEWVGKLLSYIPESAHIYVGQHCPMFRWFKDNSYTANGEKMMSLFGKRDVSILSGHTHINNNFILSDTAREFNIAALCGSWWATEHCNDGTPGGYKVFEMNGGELTWYYKSVGHDRYFQCEVFAPGQFMMHPNSIVANVWDYDENWTVEWYQDGKYMGEMKQSIELSPYYIREISKVYKGNLSKIPTYKLPRPNTHYFTAEPDQYAGNMTVVVKDCFGHEWKHDMMMRSYVDVQAHRGGAGLMPENTLQSMKNAIDMGVNTLELDLQISSDGQVVVSHDAYFHPRYATRPDGSIVGKDDQKEYIYTMPYNEVKKYDVGNRESEVWPGKACLPAYKPLANELLDFTESYTAKTGRSPMRYNIEIKSRAGKGEGINWPEYHEFVDKCMEVLLSKGLGDRLVVQCFDVRALNYMHEKYPDVKLSYLTGTKDKDFDEYMSKLEFTPDWISPHYSNVDAEFCKKAWARGMKIVPWTVDEPEDIQRMIDLKVEAIISNYPDRLLKATRGYYFSPQEMEKVVSKILK